jgi:ABC-type branched-subunit amino acid transport system substrate-binding protein
MIMKHCVWVLVLALTIPAVAWGYGEDSVPAEATAEVRYGNTPPEYEPWGEFTEPYRRFFLKPLEYTGPGRDIPEPTDIDSVKLGFLGPIMQTVSVATGGMSHEEPLGRMMLQGVRLALEQANERGGYRNDLPYELVVRNDNGLWGASGDEIIRMVYKDGVRAVIGTIDGANSHIAIRVALKCEIVMMNTGDTDPTFIETKIPWVFRCITDDRHMCYLLADYTFKKLGKERVAAVRAGNRYGRMSIDEFRDGATRLGHPLITELQYKLGTDDFSLQLDRIEALKPDAVITYGDARESALILKQMRERGMDQLFIGSDRMVCDEFLEIVGDDPGEVIAGYPFDPDMNRPKYREFHDTFVKRFGEEPDQYAAHAFDGACMVIDAIEEVGLNRAKIRDALAAMKTYEGATGEIVFDAIYNDVSPASMAILENGEWKIYNREELDIPDARTSMAR